MKCVKERWWIIYLHLLLTNTHFELKTITFRRGRPNTDECRVRIFVENSESFAFLYDGNNWPRTLAKCEFTTSIPSIPPQLAVVIPSVLDYVDREEFVIELKEKQYRAYVCEST